MAGSNTPYLAGISLCLLLGVGDLVLLNFWWAPQAWPPDSPAAGAVSTVTVQPQPMASDAAALTAPVAEVPAAPDAAAPVAAAPVAPDAAAPVAAAPVAPDAAAPAAAAPVAPDAAPATPSVTFETNSHTLGPSSRSALASLANWLRKNPGKAISIDGHADQRGDSLSNQALSLRRARAVAQFFWSRGVKRGQVHYRGHGATRPVDGRDHPAAWVKNRRVNIQIKRDGP